MNQRNVRDKTRSLFKKVPVFANFHSIRPSFFDTLTIHEPEAFPYELLRPMIFSDFRYKHLRI